MVGIKNRAVTLADRILKVDHAGEHGAVNIYRAQVMVSRWFARPYADELEDFQSHEERHRALFEEELSRRGLPRCRSYVLCGIGGFALGFLTALCGRSAIAATTLGVERVVLHHLHEQLTRLEEEDRPAYETIAAIVADEQSHHDQSALVVAEGRFWPRVLLPVVSLSTSVVIWIGMRI